MKALVWLSCLPVEKVLPNRAGTALSWRVPAQVIQLLVDSLQRHGDKVDFSNYSEIVTSACSTSFAFTYMPSRQIQPCDLEVGQIMSPKMTTIMSKIGIDNVYFPHKKKSKKAHNRDVS